MREKILVINPGSTSTKIALFDRSKELWRESISHSPQDLAPYDSIMDQIPMRRALVLQALSSHDCRTSELEAVVSRGGPFAPVKSGAYKINEAMLHKIRTAPMDQHASNTGAEIAYTIAKAEDIPSYIYDAVTVDEMLPIMRVTGLREMQRHGQGHNLNMRAAALAYCRQSGRNYDAVNLIVAHLGGGITLSLHSDGRMIDMISDDEGPFAPERAGGLPGFQLIELCYSGTYTKEEMLRHIQRQGGLMAYFGTADIRNVERQIEADDARSKLIYEAMALNVAKNIAKLSADVCGKLDAILLTGGMAYSDCFTAEISKRVRFLAPVEILPGENEMQALYEGARRVLDGEEQAHVYEE